MPTLPETLELSSGPVRLRNWDLADASALEPICGDPEVTPFTSVPSVYSEAAARAWIRLQRQRRAEGSAVTLAVVSTSDAQVVGNVNLVRFSDDGDGAAIGYWVIPEARGKGYAKSAVRALTSWAFAEFGLNEVEFLIAPHNAVSFAVAVAIGARPAGTSVVQPQNQSPPIELQKLTLNSADFVDG
jgi:RimJ/RimL family protein N-acetyltransferase